MTRIALYPGSFDPVTNGHMDILRQSLALADRVVVAIGIHPGKKPLFSFEVRQDLIHASAQAEFTEGRSRAHRCDCLFGSGHQHGTGARGRLAWSAVCATAPTLTTRMQMAGMNATLEPNIKTVFPARVPLCAPYHRHLGQANRARWVAKFPNSCRNPSRHRFGALHVHRAEDNFPDLNFRSFQCHDYLQFSPFWRRSSSSRLWLMRKSKTPRTRSFWTSKTVV